MDWHLWHLYPGGGLRPGVRDALPDLLPDPLALDVAAGAALVLPGILLAEFRPLSASAPRWSWLEALL